MKAVRVVQASVMMGCYDHNIHNEHIYTRHSIIALPCFTLPTAVFHITCIHQTYSYTRPLSACAVCFRTLFLQLLLHVWAYDSYTGLAVCLPACLPGAASAAGPLLFPSGMYTPAA
jgi:hypothetical protein